MVTVVSAAVAELGVMAVVVAAAALEEYSVYSSSVSLRVFIKVATCIIEPCTV